MGLVVIAFAMDVLISTVCIWLAGKFSFVDVDIKSVPLIVIVVSVVSLVPVVGGIAGLILFVYLLVKAFGCDLVDAIWVVLFAKLFSFVAVISISHLF